jgi:outer membrane protein assembly factor BamB
MRLATFLLLASLGAGAQNWPRFRGPNGAGLFDGDAPADLSTPAWKVPLPAGKSSPILAGGKILLTAHEGDELLTLAFDARTGRPLWRNALKKRYAMRRHKLNDSAAPTPAADSERVAVFFPEFGLAAYSLDGKPLWTHPLEEMSSMQGVSASPLLENGAVYLVVDQSRDSYLLSLNAATGKLRWKHPRPDSPGGVYSNPVLVDAAGEKALGVLGDLEFNAHSLATGEKLWWVSGLPSQAKTSPAVRGGEIVLAVNAMAEESQIPVFAALLAADANANNALDLDEAKGVPRAVFPTATTASTRPNGTPSANSPSNPRPPSPSAPEARAISQNPPSPGAPLAPSPMSPLL